MQRCHFGRLALLLVLFNTASLTATNNRICSEATRLLADMRASRSYYHPSFIDPKDPAKPSGIYLKSFGQGMVDDWDLVGKNKQAMLGGTFDYAHIEKIVSGYYDRRSHVYYVAEGHHRFAAALEIAKEKGDWAPFKQLIQEGVWQYVEAPPHEARRMPVRSSWLGHFGWRSFLKTIEPPW